MKTLLAMLLIPFAFLALVLLGLDIPATGQLLGKYATYSELR